MMIKLKKAKILAAFMAFALFPATLGWSGYPVLDVSNLMENIESVYQYYQQIQNMIEQVQNTYKRIEQAANMVKNLNFDDLKNLGNRFANLGDNPFEVITAVHDSAHDITKSVNAKMNRIQNLKNELARKSIKFGNQQVSVADLCGVGEPGKNGLTFLEGGIEYTKKVAEKNAKAWSDGLSYKQKRAIWRHFGMSPQNFAMTQITKHNLETMVTESNIKGTADAIKKTMEQDEAEIAASKKLIEEAANTESMVALQKTAANQEAETTRAVKDMCRELNKFQGLMSYYVSERTIQRDHDARLEEKRKRNEEDKLRSKGIDAAADEI